MPDGFKQRFRNFGQGKVIFETRPAIDRDKIDFPLRINPQRNFMRQSFAARNFHVKNMGRDIRVVGTSRCDVWVGTFALRCPDGAARHPYQIQDGAARHPYQIQDGAARRPYPLIVSTFFATRLNSLVK